MGEVTIRSEQFDEAGMFVKSCTHWNIQLSSFVTAINIVARNPMPRWVEPCKYRSE